MNTEKEARLEHTAQEDFSGHLHGHIHEQIHGHAHEHIHEHIIAKEHGGEEARHNHLLTSSPETSGAAIAARDSGRGGASIVTIRSHSGVSGDMLLCALGLLNLRGLGIKPASTEGSEWLAATLNRILPELGNHVRLLPVAVGGISGWRAQVELPPEHEHRNLADIEAIIAQSGMSEKGASLAISCFGLLAQCEASAHGIEIEEVRFHEVGALDSILDICGVCELYSLLSPRQLVCGPLPVADGRVQCAHGVIPAPAPAVLRLLRGLPVRPFEGAMDAGELLTPTGIALLRTLKTVYGPWPAFRMEHAELVYGQKEFRDAPNGLTVAIGKMYG